ncbi:MAG TPA: vWA domain-containing protein [Flavobacteriaceae bacterium]|nr:vWA domain-containing protein [Flavobacteriaceae bacterium]
MDALTIFWVILAAILALGLSFSQYFFGKKRKFKNRGWFVFLRFVTWFALFLLLINPKFSSNSYYVEKPALLLAVDNSSSIANFGKADEVRNFMAELKNNSELTKRFDLEIYSFGETLRPADSLSFEEKQTEIGNALRELQQIHKKKTAPIVLVTDGNQTFGEEYRYLANNQNSQIFPVVVGDTTQYTDLEITQLNANRYTFLNNKFPVEIFINYVGLKNIESEFVIQENERTVFREKVNFSPENKSKRISAILPANSIGVKTYTAKILPLDQEKNKVNNQRKFAIETIGQKTEILLLAGILHPDIGALKKAVESNEQRSVTIKTPEDELNVGEYQLVILYQPNDSFQSVFQQIKDLKINAFIITGTATDYNFLNSAQSDFEKQANRQFEDFLPEFNKNYGVFQLEDIGFDDFPPLRDRFGRTEFQNRIRPILFQNIQGITTETPLLATVEDQKGRRKAFLFGEGIWKWRAKSYLDFRSFEKFDGFLGKLVQYLASTKKRERLELSYHSFYNKGDELMIRAEYFDRNFVFDPHAKLTLVAENKDTEQRVQRPFLLKNTDYTVNLSDFPPGKYNFTVKVEGENLSKSGEFTLIDFEPEKQFMNANLNQLQEIAHNPDHQVYFLNAADLLAKDLLGNNAFLPVQKSKQKMISIIDWYYLLIVILLSLAVEWFLRKYNGLI